MRHKTIRPDEMLARQGHAWTFLMIFVVAIICATPFFLLYWVLHDAFG